MKKFILLNTAVLLLAAGAQTPIYPLNLPLANETTAEEAGSILRDEGWEVTATDDLLSLTAERNGAVLTLKWLDHDYLKDLTYTEHWDDAWGCRERFDEWVGWFRFMYGKPMVDGETFQYWILSGREIWYEVADTGGGAATLTCNITFL